MTDASDKMAEWRKLNNKFEGEGRNPYLDEIPEAFINRDAGMTDENNHIELLKLKSKLAQAAGFVEGVKQGVDFWEHEIPKETVENIIERLQEILK